MTRCRHARPVFRRLAAQRGRLVASARPPRAAVDHEVDAPAALGLQREHLAVAAQRQRVEHLVVAAMDVFARQVLDAVYSVEVAPVVRVHGAITAAHPAHDAQVLDLPVAEGRDDQALVTSSWLPDLARSTSACAPGPGGRSPRGRGSVT